MCFNNDDTINEKRINKSKLKMYKQKETVKLAKIIMFYDS